MSFQVDSNIVGAIVSALVGCVAAAGWLGWSMRSRRASREHSEFMRDLQGSRVDGMLFLSEEVGEIARPWWDDGYARGYRDGKNNRKRKDRPSTGNWLNVQTFNNLDAARSIAESIAAGVDPEREWHRLDDTRGPQS